MGGEKYPPSTPLSTPGLYQVGLKREARRVAPGFFVFPTMLMIAGWAKLVCQLFFKTYIFWFVWIGGILEVLGG
jgi:hypothetical protein